MKYSFIFLVIFLFNSNLLAQDDLLSPQDMIKKYERMFEKMLDDVNDFDHDQFGEYERLFEKNFFNQLRQLDQMHLSSSLYEWKELDDSRELVINGVFADDGKTNFEVKNKQLMIKGSLESKKSSQYTKRYIQLSIPTPSDCDETKISFKTRDGKTILSFPKIGKKLVPLKKSPSVPVI
ncbi:Hsp20/alpha crystallin family protein [Halobacteriovorax sp. HLS]|uniref:Hsp20/alpha crystallin family protein n=1 Tax=Halobacteriovorax sp. HLS TaxID=2234000 RepID=UPI000FD808E8|nr:Hsp20/alpha crystallin family protein [Halobacteriovorax sp. HLS]